MKNSEPYTSTRESAYTDRLVGISSVWWKRVLDVQRPYRWHLRHLALGAVLDVGCGVGRNLRNLGRGAVGVDHNATSVALCRTLGLEAFVSEDFHRLAQSSSWKFDALLCAHVLEHMTFSDAAGLLRDYLPYLRRGGRVVLLTPQEAGFRSDPSHVEFMDWAKLDRLVRAAGLEPTAAYSFPFPRAIGRIFKYNEFVTIATRPGEEQR